MEVIINIVTVVIVLLLSILFGVGVYVRACSALMFLRIMTQLFSGCRLCSAETSD